MNIFAMLTLLGKFEKMSTLPRAVYCPAVDHPLSSFSLPVTLFRVSISEVQHHEQDVLLHVSELTITCLSRSWCVLLLRNDPSSTSSQVTIGEYQDVRKVAKRQLRIQVPTLSRANHTRLRTSPYARIVFGARHLCISFQEAPEQ